MGKQDKKRRMYTKEFKAEAASLGTEAGEAGEPSSKGFGYQREPALPVDTTGTGSGRNLTATLPRTRTAPGRRTVQTEERSEGGVKLRFTRDPKRIAP